MLHTCANLSSTILPRRPHKLRARRLATIRLHPGTAHTPRVLSIGGRTFTGTCCGHDGRGGRLIFARFLGTCVDLRAHFLRRARLLRRDGLRRPTPLATRTICMPAGGWICPFATIVTGRGRGASRDRANALPHTSRDITSFDSGGGGGKTNGGYACWMPRRRASASHHMAKLLARTRTQNAAHRETPHTGYY